MKKEIVIKQTQLFTLVIVMFFIAACGNSASQKENSFNNEKKGSVENSSNNFSENQTDDASMNNEQLNTNSDVEIDSKTNELDNNALTVEQKILNAKKNGNAVFLIVTDSKSQDVENAESMANSAKSKVPGSLVVKVNRDAPENSSFVNELGIANVPVPFYIVYSRNGLPVSGFPYAQANVDILTKTIPGPKQDDVLVYLTDNKPVYIIVYRKDNDDKNLVVNNCKSASSRLAVNAGIVEIDFADSKESDFLKQIGVSSISSKCKTVVVNGQGQITDIFEGVVNVNDLVSSVNKVVKGGGCCPAGGGGAKGC